MLALALTPASRAPAAPAPTPSGVAPDGRLGIRLLEASVSRKDDPRARVYVVDSVKPGTTLVRRLRVSHPAGSGPGGRIPVTLYPAAATVRDAAFRFGAEGDRNDLTDWMTLSRTALALDPGGTGDLEVTIAVPARATAGERYAVIWAQTAARGPGNVRQVNRVGIRVYLDVGPGGEAPSDFAIGDVRAGRDPAGVPVLTAQVRNTGRRALDVTGQVALADGPGGVRAGPFDVTAGTTLGIGETGTVRATLDRRLPDGPWAVTVTLRSGTVRHATTVRLSFLGAPATRVAAAGAGRPVLVLGAAAVLAVLLVLALALRSRRRPTSA